MMTPTVSVIIPVYNVEAYLRACLDSVLSQTYTDWECILVDDASTDSSADIAGEYCLRDPRFRLICHEKNQGLSAARNTALDSAQGNWVTFIDSDDTVHHTFIEHHMNIRHDTNADIIMSPLGQDKSFSANHCKGKIRQITDFTDAIAECLYQRHGINSSACAKLYRRELFANVRFQEGQLYEDLQIMPRLWEQISSVAYTSRGLYNYRRNNGSIINTFSLRRLDVLKVTAEIEERYSNDAVLGPAARDRRLSANFNMFILLSRNGLTESEEATECWAQIKRLRKASLYNPKVRFKNKVGIMASYLLGRRVFALLGKKC